MVLMWRRAADGRVNRHATERTSASRARAPLCSCACARTPRAVVMPFGTSRLETYESECFASFESRVSFNTPLALACARRCRCRPTRLLRRAQPLSHLLDGFSHATPQPVGHGAARRERGATPRACRQTRRRARGRDRPCSAARGVGSPPPRPARGRRRRRPDGAAEPHRADDEQHGLPLRVESVGRLGRGVQIEQDGPEATPSSRAIGPRCPRCRLLVAERACSMGSLPRQGRTAASGGRQRRCAPSSRSERPSGAGRRGARERAVLRLVARRAESAAARTPAGRHRLGDAQPARARTPRGRRLGAARPQAEWHASLALERRHQHISAIALSASPSPSVPASCGARASRAPRERRLSRGRSFQPLRPRALELRQIDTTELERQPLGGAGKGGQSRYVAASSWKSRGSSLLECTCRLCHTGEVVAVADAPDHPQCGRHGGSVDGRDRHHRGVVAVALTIASSDAVSATRSSR